MTQTIDAHIVLPYTYNKYLYFRVSKVREQIFELRNVSINMLESVSTGPKSPLENRLKKSIQHWSCKSDVLLHITLVQLERPLEHASEFTNFSLKGFLISPCQAGIEELARNAFDIGGNLEPEDIERLVFGIEEFTRVDGVYNATSILQRAALTGAELATGPPGVDQPAGHVVL